MVLYHGAEDFEAIDFDGLKFLADLTEIQLLVCSWETVFHIGCLLASSSSDPSHYKSESPKWSVDPSLKL